MIQIPESIVSFYGTLFTTEIAAYGIIVAAILVFLQIIYSQFSYREVRAIFRRISLIICFIVSCVTLLLTTASYYLISFPNRNFLLQIHFNKITIDVNSLLQSANFSSFILFAFIFSFLLFIGVVCINARYIHPSRIVLLITKNIKSTDIQNYLFKKYGVVSPNRHESWLETLDNKDFDTKTHERNNKIYDKIKLKSENAYDPLEPLDALIQKSINNSDLAVLNEADPILVDMAKKMIAAYQDKLDIKGWNPYSETISQFLKYLMEIWQSQIELSNTKNFELAKLKILKTSADILKLILLHYKFREINIFLSFWKKLADDNINTSSRLFNTTISYYQEIFDSVAKSLGEKSNDILDEIFRNIGWLSERLLLKKGIEQKPIMADDYYSDFDNIFNTLISFENLYEKHASNAYPLIYFDAIYVTLCGLIPLLKKSHDKQIQQYISTCLYTIGSFATSAAYQGNNEGVCLSVATLKKFSDELLKENLEEDAKYAVRLLTKICGETIKNIKKFKPSSHFGKVDSYIIGFLEKLPFVDVIGNELHEIYIRSTSANQDDIWSLITTLGLKMRTNFGFMFDWQTGEIYADDDPRRR